MSLFWRSILPHSEANMMVFAAGDFLQRWSRPNSPEKQRSAQLAYPLLHHL
ncbi:hypothetical protein J2045_001834 [Peteryoungia aggregata LMG 23059]|uniref:Uncharacterized protein n=1 Tax=Peteryoungia aggregata LMG 23059 TaxID=1368425 RepID=A0ABU0G640_9HYPH|nr:hypothetical protein [Peteryoungia aggregata]MDQ0420810.1 hypothetical protein [Peteryoungia aggregata LMG 23059]